MEVRPNYCNLYTLFDSSVVFIVPKYQRGYSWTDDEVGDFCSDIEGLAESGSAEDKEHFFGALVCAEIRKADDLIPQFELVDGQQRLATFTLLIARIKKRYSELSPKNDTQSNFLKSKIGEISKRYLKVDYLDNMVTKSLPRLSLSKQDDPFFQELIQGDDPAPSRESHKRLLLAVELIDKSLYKLITKKRFDLVAKELEVIEKSVTGMGFVIHVSASKVSDAYRLFQVLNDRGLNLSAGDLLRALTLEKLDIDDSQSLLISAEKIWDDLLDEKSPKVAERLRWYFASHAGRFPGKASLYEDFKKYFEFDAVDNMTKRKALVERLEDMKKAFSFFSSIEDCCWPYHSSGDLPLWNENRLKNLIQVMRHTHCMPLLYAMFKAGKEKQFLPLLRLLERFFFRYKVICRGHVTPMSDIYLEYASTAIANKKPFTVQNLSRDLRDLLKDKADEEQLKGAIKKLEYKPKGSNKELKYLLISIEEDWSWIQSGKSIAHRPKMEDVGRVFDFKTSTIEHIYARNSRGKDIDSDLEPVKNKIGNLTILDPKSNSGAGNAPWSKKKVILRRSNVQMNKKVSGKSRWGKTQFDQHEQMLLKAACKVFCV
jgi:uncharacterized protein with ParB-like and HNH nuclease domain